MTELRNEDGEPIGVVKKLKLTDRLGALTLLARHLGMLNDKLTLKGDAENPLTLLVKAIQGNTIRPVANPPADATTASGSVWTGDDAWRDMTR